MGAAIPKNLPSSTLACPPSASYIKQFMPNGATGGSRGPKAAHRLGQAEGGFRSSRGKENRVTKTADSDVLSRQLVDKIKSEIHVLEYVDYSSKYGVGYMLNDGCFGVFFNDSSKILYNSKEKLFHYLARRKAEEEEKV